MKTTLYSHDTALTIEYSQKGDEIEALVDGQPLTARLLFVRKGALTLLVNGKPLHLHLVHEGQRTLVAIEGRVYTFTHAQEKQGKARRSEIGRLEPEVRSPMPGKILQVLTTEGALVDAGQTLILLEAMKMENALTAEGAALVKKVHISPGDLVDLGQVLVELEFIKTEAAVVQDN